MTLEPHIHCAECFRQIETKIKIAGGKTKDVQIHQGTQFAVVPGPDGVGILPRLVPLCVECHESIAKQEKAASKLIVPQMHPPKLRTIK